MGRKVNAETDRNDDIGASDNVNSEAHEMHEPGDVDEGE